MMFALQDLPIAIVRVLQCPELPVEAYTHGAGSREVRSVASNGLWADCLAVTWVRRIRC